MPVKEHTNRLINEKSPYLLQHAHNPVDWYPWGNEAFEKAKREDKPVFLSIGYSTCHWCHVMERESFEDEQVASILNRHFVSVKVDREERPDIDAFYMDACMALNRSGGWPLSCFLTVDKKPFFAGTYFPKESGPYGTGFLSILSKIAEIWKTDREKLLESARIIFGLIGQAAESKTALDSDAEINAYRQLENMYDPEFGGFGTAPKFPSLQNIIFLLRFATVHPETKAASMVGKTLDCMAAGGIFDHIGGGFSRYSTDREWLVPHFEKMMADNAMHMIAYSEAAGLFGNRYAKTADKVEQFCLREMHGDSGEFYTALDADSEGVEGKFYLFTPDEVKNVLGDTDATRYCRFYHITPAGNFEHKSIPNLIGTSLAAKDRAFLDSCNFRLLKYRNIRVLPFKDDQSLAFSNGLMTAALAIKGRLLHQSGPITAAQQCARFILCSMVKNGRLLGRWRMNQAGIPAVSDDYATVIWGFLELYETTFAPEWLGYAVDFTQRMNALFWDEKEGGYFLTGNDAENLPLRQKNLHDAALPSGNSIAAYNLLRLARLCADSRYEKMANRILSVAAPELNVAPAGFCWLLCSLLYLKNGGTEIILVNGDNLDNLKKGIPDYLPFAVTSVCGKGYEGIYPFAPFLKDYQAIGSKATAYVCRHGSCREPVTSAEELSEILKFDSKN